MVLAIHLKCAPKKGDGETGFVGLVPLKSPGLFRSEYWQMSEDQARSLLGGWLYLHETKSEPSYFAGIVEDVLMEPFKGKPRAVFILRKHSRITGQTWRGQSHTMAHNGYPVPATLPHEVATAGAVSP